MQFESHRQGGGGSCGAGGPGATQKRKRGCGDNMDTEAVQTTLEAMRIQVIFVCFLFFAMIFRASLCCSGFMGSIS